jgi:hypothetical protein
MRGYEPRRILIVVKTYPNPSRKYGETVCCAGVDLDTDRWVRIYPITFRQLADKRFAKYQIIECLAKKPNSDNRPESIRVDQDSIKLDGTPLPSGDTGWRRRMALLPPPATSLEEIHDAQRVNGTSLGMLRPRRIERLVIEPAKPWSASQEAHIRQQRLNLGAELSTELSELKQIPWKFSYRFTCDDERCNGHQLQIEDWEIGQSFRSWSRSHPGNWQAMIKQKYEEELPGRDLHLVVGNLAKHHGTFVIIGLVRPPRMQVDGGYVQETLDLMGQQGAMTGGRVRLEAEQADALGLDEGDESLQLFPDEE